MKYFIKSLSALFIVAFFTACSTRVDDESPCPQWQIMVYDFQKIRLLDSTGNWSNTIDYENLELIPTNEKWEPIYGEFQQSENFISAIYFAENTEPYIRLALGQTQQMYDISKNTCYFILKVNETEYHTIRSSYDTNCGNFILTNFNYNGVDYTANQSKIIDVKI